MKISVLGMPGPVIRPSFLSGTAALALAVSSPAFAQDVLLESPDGSMSISGALVGLDDEFYTVEGQLGVIRVPRSAVDCSGDACPVVVEEPAPVVATREIVLHSVDDETRISGELVDVDDTHYVIRNPLGEFRIKLDGVICEGAACPVIEIIKTEFAFHVPSAKVGDMMVDLLRDYSEDAGYTFSSTADGDTSQSVQLFSGEEQELVAEIDLTVSGPDQAATALSDRSVDVVFYNQLQIDTRLASIDGLDTVLRNVLAYDGEVIVGNEDNPVRDLSLAEIGQIATQNLTSWQGLGGGDFPISVHMLEDGFGAPRWLNGTIAASTLGVVTHETEEQVIEAVNADRNAIGVVHQTTAARDNAKMLAVRDVCGLTAVPTQFGLRTEHYPFTQPISSYARVDSAAPFVLSFLEWTQTPLASSAVSEWGYTGASLQRTRIEDMGNAVIHAAASEPDFDGAEFSNMMRELRTADRLSMTFTFISGSTVLDDGSAQRVRNLAQRIREAQFGGHDVLLVGFADNTGPAGPNSALSLRRAEAVRSALAQEFNPSELEQLSLISMGFGEQMPVQCNETDLGRANNRRVEVWVRRQG
ncbi:phosphate ABC transporter substrate-binding/OmpA family protein [Octadecabacter sp. CECT 8868]|uniref:OmpA family protein n=1 Tax=Octadecabacter algicola TaxID=2909342 RepID=UPI001F4329D4|nr:phosphate ABC transporter substrate-binding/OmpA family protein [Octadecabacter algicola]MCF2903983.1 phosphate ABC transporter substrate-binding/OmpA family protein [Octadecabacter algicola]